MTITASNPTVLVLSGVGVPPYSARGIKQTLTPIAAAVFIRRTVNGILRDLSQAQFHKWKSTLSCSDVAPPATDGMWPGTIVTVDCIEELSYLTGSGGPYRSVVSGSSRVVGAFTLYRPQLVMMVMNFTQDTDEWSAGVSWSIELEEVGA
jgi:hypothetical protein